MLESTDDKQVVFIGETNFRNSQTRFGIKTLDRRRHIYMIGSTGMGKSELLKNMAIQDMEAGRGVCFIDPHGDGVYDLLDFVPEERTKDVIYFDPGDLDFPIAFNPMERVPFDYRHLVASGLLGVFKKIWPDVWSGRMEYILNNTILALLEYPDTTLLSINRMLSGKDYRKKVVANIKDPIVKSFWIDEFAKYTDRYAQEATPAILNKIGQFTSNNLIRNIIGQPNSKIDMRKIMDEKKILLVNVSRGRIGEDASRLLGALLVTKIQLAAMSRVDVPESERPDFYLYVDEFQHFATESFVNILSEARKYHLNLTMGNQYINQMEETVRDAVFGNVGTIITFRVGAEDAEFLEKWFQPEFTLSDIVNLAKYTVYIKLMIDGISSKAFSAGTLPPFPKPERSFKNEIISASRESYTVAKDVVEKETADWMGSMDEDEGASQNQPGDDRRETPKSYDREPRRNQGGRDRGWDRGGRGGRDNRPRREPNRMPNQMPAQNQPKPASLSALSTGAVDFKGRKLESKPEKPKQPQQKKEVDLDELRNLLKESLDKK